MKKILNILICCAALGCAPAMAADAPKPMPLQDLLSSVNKGALGAAGARRIRLGVATLKDTGSSRYTDKGFGAFLTEKISSSLASAGPKVRLFERTMLDSVMKEQALSAGGLINKEEALKIGELAPIDYLLAGTFTRLDGSAAVNLRLIDVVSGEVAANVAGTIELTPEMAGLFADAQAPVEEEEDPEAACERAQKPVKALMADVGTPDKVAALAAAAVKLPFDGSCGGNIHYKVMDLLERYSLPSAAYDAFLFGTLKGITDPDADDRAGSIAGFLLGRADQKPQYWDEALRAAAASKRFYSYVDMLLAGYDGGEASLKRLKERFGAIMNLAAQKRLGRPVPLETGKVFLDLMHGLSSRYAGAYAKKDFKPLAECYQAYGDKYASGAGPELLKLLGELYKNSPAADKPRALGWFCARLNALEPSRDAADEAVDLLRPLFDARKEALKKDPAGGEPAAELKRVVALCGPRLAALLPFIVGRDYRLDVTALCLENGVKAAGLPTLDSLTKALASEDSGERGDAVRLMKALGPAARSSEAAVIKRLSRSDDRYFTRDLISLLGAMKSADPEAHRLIIEQMLDGTDSYVSDEAVAALAAIGAPAAPALKAAFPKVEESYKKVYILNVFKLRGKGAAADLPWLKSVMAAATDKYVRNAAEDAADAAAGK